MAKKNTLVHPHLLPLLLMIHSFGCSRTLDQTHSPPRITSCVPLEGRSRVVYLSMGRWHIHSLPSCVLKLRYCSLGKKQKMRCKPVDDLTHGFSSTELRDVCMTASIHNSRFHPQHTRLTHHVGQLPGDKSADNETTVVRQEHWLNDVHSFTLEGPYVYSWLAGSSARAMERAPTEQVQDGMLSLLRTVTKDASWQVTGEEPRDIATDLDGGEARNGGKAYELEDRAGEPSMHLPRDGDEREPSAVTATIPTEAASLSSLVRTTWALDPLFRGSYSFIAAGSSPADIEELARPLVSRDSGGDGRGGEGEPRVFFAGEATHPIFYSTTHGGFESGRRAAEEVLTCRSSQDQSLN